MQITITCDSYDELIATAKQILRDHVDEPVPKPVKPTTKTVKKAEPEEEPLPFESAPAEDKTVDETAVKVLLADKIKNGKKAEVRALFEEYGVTKLSELTAKHPDKLADFAAKAEVL